MAKIFISPSTQEWNRYAGGGNEEEWMRKVSQVAVQDLVAAGHAVKMGGTISAKDNAIDANKWGAQWYVAVHSNAGSSGHGTECWYYTGSEKGELLAKAIYEEVAAVSEYSDRGIKHSKEYIELRKPAAPACIVEIAFHDKLNEANEIKTDYAEFGHAIARGILKVVGGSISVPKLTPTSPSKPKMPILKKGDTGEAVRKLQTALRSRGYRIKVDGIFGTHTRDAVRAFQWKARIKVDGIVGPVTWSKLGY